MKYKYLILDLIDGAYKGTNSKDIAVEYAQSEDFFVADVERGLFLYDSKEESIKEVTRA